MMKKFYRIGSVLQKSSSYEEYFTSWSNPFPKISSGGAVVIVVKTVGGKIVDLELEEFRSTNVSYYLYRKPPGANASNLVPTLIFNKDTAYKKIIQSLKSLASSERVLRESEYEKLATMLDGLELDSKIKYLITFKVDGKWFGEYPEYVQLFEGEAYQKYEKFKAQNQLCAVTYKQVPEVWGGIDTLGFTVNDRAFCRNGFRTDNAYKMFSAEPEAVKILEGTRRLLFERLSKYFMGMQYMVLPSFLSMVPDDIIEEIMNKLLAVQQEDEKNERALRGLISKEDLILEILEDEGYNLSSIYYDVLFYKQAQAQFMIKAHITDVLPSMFRRLLEVKELLEGHYQLMLRQVFPGKKKNEPDKVVDYVFNFGELAQFYVKKTPGGGDIVFHPGFFAVVEALFYGRFIDRGALLEVFMQHLTQQFKQAFTSDGSLPSFYHVVLESFFLYQYFSQLGMLQNEIPTQLGKSAVQYEFDPFLEQHETFFKGSAYRKAIFLMGALTSDLLSAQYKKLGAEPFYKRLHNLRLGQAELVRLWPELLDKMKQYEIDGYGTAYQAEVSAGLIAVEPMQRAEISYLFTLGMSLKRTLGIQAAKAKKAGKEVE